MVMLINSLARGMANYVNGFGQKGYLQKRLVTSDPVLETVKIQADHGKILESIKQYIEKNSHHFGGWYYVASLVALPLGGMYAMYQGLNKRFEEINKRFDQLDSKIDTVETKLNSRINDLEKNLDSRINDLDKKLDSGINDVDKKLDSRINDVEKQVSNISTKIDHLITDVSRLDNDMREIRTYIFQSGKISSINEGRGLTGKNSTES